MSQDPASPYQADRAHAQQVPAGRDQREQAARLDKDNPQWIIVWGIYTLEFVAFPLFRVPDGTVLCTRSAPELMRRMQQTEAVYGAASRTGESRHG